MLGGSEAHVIAALLHDTIEDTDTTKEEIEKVFGEEIADAVDSVSRRDGEKYADFILRAKAHPIGRIVKIADLWHNMSPERVAQLPPEMKSITNRYEKALQTLWDNT